ncbi:glycosyltransferase family 4 protein [Polyangium fumosum]|uniref:Glycosyltransferase family 1 protein n=1 Tax=Polyangium fumosum TaxID=889272 RepID=A0A4U1JCQ7_9BACT|nr:glycosyltransferase family 4 protein [Polyangium fumosum]TKD08427.1 glycosyltransferase family 1 protein [Polyangium fumosum]
MRIVYLAPNIPVPGTHGGSTHVSNVHRALSKRHDVLLYCRAGSTQPGALARGFNLHPVLQKGFLPVAFARVVGAVRAFRPDVIYERYSAFGLGPMLARATGAPCVLMTLDRDASALSFRYSDRIVATSAEFIPEEYRDKLRIVHWGVDVDGLVGKSGEAVRARYAPRGERIVLYTGSFPDWHGVEVLVEVARSWAGPDVVFLLVGDGQDKRRVERLAASRGVSGRVVFAGRVPHGEIGAYIDAADVCVAPYAPSKHPIFRVYGMNRDPIKVLEYMALGKVAVTIDTPRMRELFQADEEVLLYRAEDPDALRRTLMNVLTDAELCARVGSAGASLVRSRYTWSHHAEELEAVFDEVVRR